MTWRLLVSGCWKLLALTLLSGAMLGCASNARDSAPADAPPSPQRLGAVGIGVSDLAASSRFYRQVLGLEVLRVYELGYLDEIVLGSPHSPDSPSAEAAVLVLMHWPGDTERQYDGRDVKVVFYADDPAAVIDRIRAQGGRIDREALPHPALNGRRVGLGRDPNNYLIEVVER